MNRKLHFILGCFLLCFVGSPGWAQPKPAKPLPQSPPASLAFRAGFNRLYGDLEEQRATPFWGASLLIPVTKTVTLEFPVDVGTLRAQQDDFYHSTSKARFIQAALVGSVDVMNWLKPGNHLVEVSPYAGAGLIFFRAEAYDLTTGKLQRLTNNENSHRTRDGIETRGKPGIKRTHELVWPVGLRIATALSRRASVFGDVRYNLVRSDKLDATLDNNNQVIQPGTPAFTEGNHYGKNSQDKWGCATVGVNFYFGERFKKN